MKSIRIPAALFLLAITLCTGTAIAQPQIPGNIKAKESFTLTPDPVFTTVSVALEDDPDPDPKKVWKVVAGSAENAAKLSWKVDARCGVQLQSLSVKDAAGGNHSLNEFLTSTTKNLQKPLVNLPSFSAQFIKQLCLDIANVTFVTAQGDAEKKEALEDLQDAFEDNLEAETTVDGGVFLSGRCTNGVNATTSVTDKKFPAKTVIRCIR
ncbi:MAG TPA: hypothetical protein VN493_07965 [Thermoanaerobaculia bacterium]|nr:hypothetical protein [Thermoanaerobaculia bacterium]